MTQKNSFISLMEQISLLNKNSVEIISKLNDVVGSSASSITVNLQEDDGGVSQYQLPTVGFLKREIDIANSNIKKLSGLESDNSVIIVDGETTRKIQSVDINREPSQIDNLNTVTQFKQNNNWFFEGMMNPLLSVELDLQGQIDEHVKKVLSSRYIVKFERNEDGTLTDEGLTSQQDFETKFLNRNDFTINEFLNWMTNDTNAGVLNRTIPDYYKDDQMFDLNYKEVNYKGFYSVMKIETDRLNNKLWYHLDTLSYFGRDGSTGTLSIGDTLTLNKSGRFSRYNITEINTSSSLFRVAIERIEGYDPIPVGTNVLEFYSSLTSQKTVKISIGFDEYNVIFLRPINTDNYIIASSWSKGMSFYSNDLVLDTDSNVAMNDFYLDSVQDYGAILNDLVKKNIPSAFGSVPNTTQLNNDNFKVVQINKHLTDTKDETSLKKLHAQKNSSKSKLQQVNEAITEKNRELNIKSFKSVAEKSKAQNELDKLIKNQESETKLLSSLISQITNAKSESKSTPKYRIRGFWDIPDPIIKDGYRSQEVIGFEVQYRYSSKFGTENSTEGFEVSNTVVGTESTTRTGYFANWIPYNTDLRKRAYDEVKSEWYWEIEDISDADTPNINQLDIPINPDEKVEVRIRSISEVGYPETPLTSDWGDSLTVDFPDELKDVLGENEFIMKEANQEEMRVNFENELTAKGITNHVSEAFYANEKYYAHNDTSIATSFKDSFGNTLTLFDYLKQINDKITSLEEAIKRAKGELKVTLFKGVDETVIDVNSVTNITIYCDDYANLSTNSSSTYSTRYFDNNVYLVQDYFIEFENIATDNPLGLITNSLGTISPILNKGINNSTYVNDIGTIFQSENDQYIYLLNEVNNSSDKIYGGLKEIDTNDVSLPIGADILILDDVNLGGNFGGNILNDDIWSAGSSHWITIRNEDSGSTKLGSTVHPFLNTTKDLINTDGLQTINASENIRIPLNVYFKMDVTKENGSLLEISSSSTPQRRTKKLKFYMEVENKERPMQFELNFVILSHRNFLQQPTSNLQTI